MIVFCLYEEVFSQASHHTCPVTLEKILEFTSHTYVIFVYPWQPIHDRLVQLLPKVYLYYHYLCINGNHLRHRMINSWSTHLLKVYLIVSPLWLQCYQEYIHQWETTSRYMLICTMVGMVIKEANSAIYSEDTCAPVQFARCNIHIALWCTCTLV